ncbi:MAG TPA: phosphoribosylglycinamide synthetase C domain-containing protein, partial [Longimicrobiales bacterium]|nr:phosphoribosylglycinamide synthetase C domain-containing protein [Longimicrobiales bacterium]
ETLVFHAGTTRSDGRLTTSGGRVLAATGLGPDIPSAARKSREAAERITFEGRQFRTDIAWREIQRAGAA